MGRKKPTRFDWVRDRDEPDTPRVERRSRREKTEPLDRAMDLIEQIRNQPAASWPNLPLSEEALQMLRHLVQIKPKARGAIRRQRMLLARALAEEDLDAIAEAVGADGGTSDRDEALELRIHGDTPAFHENAEYLGLLRERARAQVRFMGHYDNEEMPELQREVDILVVPS